MSDLPWVRYGLGWYGCDLNGVVFTILPGRHHMNRVLFVNGRAVFGGHTSSCMAEADTIARKMGLIA